MPKMATFARVFVFLLLLCIFSVLSASPTICNHSTCQNTTLDKNSEVYTYCKDYNLTVDGRCCMNGSMAQGIDLSSCNVTSTAGIFQNLIDLTKIVLIDNPLVHINKEDFLGLTRLDYISLPNSGNLTCPGLSESWEVALSTANALICENQVDFCKDNNTHCPSNSECAMDGPGQTACQCMGSYYGYKCLRQGTFPTTAYAFGAGGSVIGLSLFLWITQRRNVKKVQ